MHIKQLYNKLALLIIAALISGKVFAWPPTYGPEFEFVNDTILDNWNNELADFTLASAERKKLEEYFRHNCTECKFVGNNIILKGGYSFQINYDPGTIEIQAAPKTLEELKKFAPAVNKNLFRIAKEAGFYPDHDSSAGHFNIGLQSAFANGTKAQQTELFLRYFVDFINHAELAQGIWMNDPLNAPAFEIKNEEYTRNQNLHNRPVELANIIAAVEKKKINDIPTLINKIEDNMNYGKYEALRISLYTAHYPDVIRDLNDKEYIKQTLEIRAMKAQESLEDFILAAELFELRLAFLKTQTQPIEYISSKNLSKQEKLDRYFLYVTDAGGDWEKFQGLMHPDFKLRKVSDYLLKPATEFTEVDLKKLFKNHKFINTSPLLQQKLIEIYKTKRFAHLKDYTKKFAKEINFNLNSEPVILAKLNSVGIQCNKVFSK